MQIQKTIRAKITNLTNIKREKLEREYNNFQLWMDGLDFLTDELYSATKQHAERLSRKLKYSKEKQHPLVIRRDCFRIEKKNTKISKYWCKVPVFNHGECQRDKR